ncbi:MAG: PSD1 and planctomycete cytochrome C domain-containing protein [Planctomycetaceae bacterium]
MRFASHAKCAAGWSVIWLLLVIASASTLLAEPIGSGKLKADKVSFDRDVRPILSNHCWKCHGPDANERKANLRLDQRESAIKPAESGKSAIVPSHPADSELLRRVLSSDSDEQMPPASENKPLSAAQKEILKRWIEQGATFEQHWSFRPVTRPAVPETRNLKSQMADFKWQIQNPIDHFVLSRLDAEGLTPFPEADRETLIRRVTLDLTGLPPTIAEIDEFLNDREANAYERVVDRLLKSPHYGERMALDWLDASRFADTNGYHIDNGRDMTRWRKWVIDAFNRNLPFDQFTIQQLAGDLLPEPADPIAATEQKLASGFHRNHMINFEGGAFPKEYHNAYIVDRVNTTATVWLGLTLGCSQCHDHKYDPLTQREYYQLYAFFHNVPENGLDGRKGNAEPLLKIPTEDQQKQLAELANSITQQDARLKAAKGDEAKTLKAELDRLRKQQTDLEQLIPTSMIMREMDQPRETFLLVRGQYDKPGEKVTAEVPAVLSRLPDGAPRNRLGLAQWLTHPSHPLTARVTVNRYWQSYFGTGLVKTSEDFGSQGEPPSHPELLDWLAAEFMGEGARGREGEGETVPSVVSQSHRWDVKHLQRLIVTSATYRQLSRVTPALVARDPENRLLARGARHRLPAEGIRDLALSVSGLLQHKLGGPSVSPYQPAGLWEELMARADGKNWTAQEYSQSHGADLYRRTMYTFWKRTCPPAQLATFDAPDRETCTVRRARTNTPLQALVLMNDPTYVEASRKFAERILLEGGATLDQRITFAFRLATARRPTPRELTVLRRVFEQQLARFQADPATATKLLSVGEAARNEQLPIAELAAWSAIANLILNLDETVTKG